jgi:hypothetical protein
MIGDIASLGQSVYEAPIKYGLQFAEKRGLLPKGKTAEDFIKEARKIGTSEPELEGKVSTIGGVPFPTSAGLAAAEKKQFPFLEYEGKTPESRFYGDVAGGVTSMLPGGGGILPAIGRGAVGGLGVTAGKGLSEAPKAFGVTVSPTVQQYLEPVGTLLGTAGSLMAGRATLGSKLTAAEGVASAMSKDVKSGAVTQEMINEAQRSGVPLADIFPPGTYTREYLERAAGRATGPAASAVEAYSAGTGRDAAGIPLRIPESQSRIMPFLEQVNRAPINAPQLQQSIQVSGATTRNNVYNLARQNPNAQSIDFGQLGTTPGTNRSLVNHPMMAEAIKDANSTAASAPASWGIVAPTSTTHGNLPYWDQVKKELDREIKAAAPTAVGPGDPSRVASLKVVRDQLVNQLDNIVPQYGAARNKALETFMADTAPEAGVEFYKNMSIFNRAQASNAFSQMSPQIKSQFKEGWLHSLSDEASRPNGINSIARKFSLDKNFQDNAKLVLGQDYDAVRGKMIFENLTTKAKEIIPKTEGLRSLIKGGTPAALAWVADMAIQSQFLLPQHSIAATGVAAATGAGMLARAKYLKNIANKTIPLMTSENPKDISKLSKLMDSNPEFSNLITNMNTIVQGTGSSSGTRTESRPVRATGGRIGMTAERLLSMLEGAKRSVQKDTEALLQEPDEKIAKALTIAKEGI